jgi:Na+/proline symporter
LNIKPFTLLDWAIIALFFAGLALFGYLLQRYDGKKIKTETDYFLAGRAIPSWLAAVSTIATMQSAATFLGVPDFGFKGDYTYLSTNIGTIIGAAFVGIILIPRFYAANVSTVYEMLEIKYSKTAMRSAGAMFLIGRVLAEGSRIYLAAIAVSMIIFGDISFEKISIASFLIIIFSFLICFFGGLKSVIWTDFALFIVYIGVAIGSIFYLLHLINLPMGEIFAKLKPDGGIDKTKLINLSADLKTPFSLWAIIFGMSLLSLASFGLDQDITQRLLASKDAKTGIKSLYSAAIYTIPIVAIFLFIGSLLYVFYSQTTAPVSKFKGENISVFMYFILTEIPVGLRALAVVGVLSAAISTVNSALNSMSSVMIQDFYKPLVKAKHYPESHFVKAGMVGMLIVSVFLLGMAILSYIWQKASDIPFLEFVLGVMTFAYAGLLGVYFAAIFTNRGNTVSVIAALLGGFLTIALLQPYIGKAIGLPEFLVVIAFPWKLLIGSSISFMIAISAKT